jgi:hypothetical protein
MYRGFEELVSVDASEIDSLASDLESSTTSVQCEECDHEFEVDADISGGIDEIQSAAQNIQGAVSTAEEDLRKFLAFVKTFGPREFSTIYCEREWRSTQPFRFKNQDVAMIILPKRSASRSFFDDFVKTRAKGLRIHRSIPVVPWEDLIEH